MEGERERKRGSEREVVRGGGGSSTERFRQIRRRGIKQREGERDGESVCEARRDREVERGKWVRGSAETE